MQPQTLLVTILTVSAMNSGCGIYHALVSDDDAEIRERQKAADDHHAAHAAAIAAAVATPCQDYEAAYQRTKCFQTDHGHCTSRTQEQTMSMLFRLAECGNWTTLFRYGPSDEQLSDLATKHPILDGLVAVLAKGGELFRPQDANDLDSRLHKLSTWIEKAHGAEACPRIAPHHAALGAAANVQFTWLYFNAGCAKESLARARPNLVSDDHLLRAQACTILGKFGDKSDADKLSLLAMRDPYRREAETLSHGQFVSAHYPVRDACSAAANKLLLR